MCIVKITYLFVQSFNNSWYNKCSIFLIEQIIVLNILSCVDNEISNSKLLTGINTIGIHCKALFTTSAQSLGTDQTKIRKSQQKCETYSTLLYFSGTCITVLPLHLH